MKEPYSFGKPINGDHYEVTSPLSNHDSIICRIQYYHDYLFQQAQQLINDDDGHSQDVQILLERLICVHYELFQDFIFSEGFQDED